MGKESYIQIDMSGAGSAGLRNRNATHNAGGKTTVKLYNRSAKLFNTFEADGGENVLTNNADWLLEAGQNGTRKVIKVFMNPGEKICAEIGRGGQGEEPDNNGHDGFVILTVLQTAPD